jgi:uncharacterized FlgJ-related protein
MDNTTLIYSTAIADGMPDLLAQLIAAQAAHETGNFTSNVFKSCNNAFGYKYVGQSIASPCTKSPELNSYAGYASVEDSVHEITGWIKRRQKAGTFPSDLETIKDPDQYAQLLKDTGYYGDTESNYANGVSYYFNLFASKLQDFFRKAR